MVTGYFSVCVLVWVFVYWCGFLLCCVGVLICTYLFLYVHIGSYMYVYVRIGSCMCVFVLIVLYCFYKLFMNCSVLFFYFSPYPFFLPYRFFPLPPYYIKKEDSIVLGERKFFPPFPWRFLGGFAVEMRIFDFRRFICVLSGFFVLGRYLHFFAKKVALR